MIRVAFDSVFALSVGRCGGSDGLARAGLAGHSARRARRGRVSLPPSAVSPPDADQRHVGHPRGGPFGRPTDYRTGVAGAPLLGRGGVHGRLGGATGGRRRLGHQVPFRPCDECSLKRRIYRSNS